MTIARLVAPLAPLLLASTAAIAQGMGEPGPAASAGVGPSTSASGSSAPSTSAPAVPSNAPIMLSPGVSSAPKSTKVPAVVESADAGTRRTWFGWQTLAFDVVVVGTSAVLLRTMEERSHLAIVIGASALFIGSGPLIHLANGSGRAGDSLLIRAGGLGIGALAGATLLSGLAGCTTSTPCRLETVDFAAIGAAAGAMIAMIIDGTVYGWKPARSTTAHIMPSFARIPGGAIGGLNIVF